MNAPVNPKTVAVSPDALNDARDNAWHNFGSAAHYLGLAQGFLQANDDAGACYALAHAREYWISAVRDFAPCRAAFRARVDNAEGRRDA